MSLFRAFLVLIFLTVMTYTGIVISRHGMDLLPVFFGDIVKLAWPGQFNLDFSFMLCLTGLWVAYRHRFRGPGLLLGLCAVVGGVFFLSAYLLVETRRSGNSAAALLLGENHSPRSA